MSIYAIYQLSAHYASPPDRVPLICMCPRKKDILNAAKKSYSFAKRAIDFILSPINNFDHYA